MTDLSGQRNKGECKRGEIGQDDDRWITLALANRPTDVGRRCGAEGAKTSEPKVMFTVGGSLCLSNLRVGVYHDGESCYTCRGILGALIGTDRALGHSPTCSKIQYTVVPTWRASAS